MSSDVVDDADHDAACPSPTSPLSPEQMLSRHTGACCCFCFPIPSRGKSAWERIGPANAGKFRWWNRAIFLLRQWSEIVAGPRWKTFIRRFNRGGGGRRKNRFQYDPLSYAMNFDEGIDDLEAGGAGGYRGFSSRFAAPVSAKSSMDLGGEDAPGVFGDCVVAPGY